MGVEAPVLVTWDMAFCAPVPYSMWVAPPEGLTQDELQKWKKSEPLTPGGVKGADRQQLSLEKLTYPEGYEAVRIIDDKTGLWTDDGYRHESQYYGKLEAILRRGSTYNPDRTIFLGEGRRLVEIYLQRSTIDAPYEEGILNVTTTINTGERTISIEAEETRALTKGKELSLRVDVEEEDGAATAFVDATVHVGKVALGRLAFNLDQEGVPQALDVYRSGVLDLLGVKERPAFDYAGEAKITDPEQQRLLFQKVLKTCLGVSGSQLDLRQTAAGLYLATGRPDRSLQTCVKTKD